MWNAFTVLLDSTSTDGYDGDAGGEDSDTVETLINSIDSSIFMWMD